MTAIIIPFRAPRRVPFRVSMRALLDRVNDGWSEHMVPAGERFICSPRRAAELLSIRAARLVAFDADDVAAIASFTADSAATMLKLSLALGIRPE
jgi:hypothetical protein